MRGGCHDQCIDRCPSLRIEDQPDRVGSVPQHQAQEFAGFAMAIAVLDGGWAIAGVSSFAVASRWAVRSTGTLDAMTDRPIARLQGFRVTDPLDFQIPKSLDEPVAELISASADPDLGHAEARNDLPVLALNI
jgi:hypothetical protein